ncbi:MAG: hypothetical protein ACRD68_16135, partial [Pyrinomonadaceae bacterium]
DALMAGGTPALPAAREVRPLGDPTQPSCALIAMSEDLSTRHELVTDLFRLPAAAGWARPGDFRARAPLM